MGIFRPKKPKKENDPKVHSDDIKQFGGYEYAVSDAFSARHANRRISDAILSAFSYAGKKVIDIGCGDGAYTFEILQQGKPSEIVGVDPATEAIKHARASYSSYGMAFYDYSIYDLPFADGHFDIAVVRGVVHHLDSPAIGVREAVRVSKKIVFTDPNGYNPGCKIIEKISPYHRKHKEMSYFPFQHNRWLREAGASIIKDYYVLLVPMFFPEALARFLAELEPFFEKNRVLQKIFCGTHVRVAENIKFK